MGQETIAQDEAETQALIRGKPSPKSAAARGSRGTFAALAFPNYRLWFAGQLVSLMGTWMQSTAQGYLVYELTLSPAYLGYVAFANGIPSWIFTLWGGLVADRMSRRNLLVLTQTWMMVQAFFLAWLTFSGRVQPWHIVALAFLLGIANAFDAPARQAFVVEMVSRETLTNAIALNSTMFNSATAVGPAIAGLTYAAFGPAWCFMINGISYLAVIAALLRMKLAPVPHAPRQASAAQQIAAGVRYVAGNQVVRTVILNLMVLSLFGISFQTLLPAWAVEILGGDATTNGFLQSARGVGAVAGALMIASMGSYAARGRLLLAGALAFPILLLVYSQVRWLPLALLVLVGIGWGFMTQANSSNALVQLHVPDELRGRVMSIFTLSFFGFLPLGSLLAGWVADSVGEPLTVILGGSIVLAFVVLVLVRMPELRRA